MARALAPHYARGMLRDRAGLPEVELADLDAAISGHRILADVARWCGEHRHAIHTVVTQDEYTHDVVVRLADDRFLVYDTT